MMLAFCRLMLAAEPRLMLFAYFYDSCRRAIDVIAFPATPYQDARSCLLRLMPAPYVILSMSICCC